MIRPMICLVGLAGMLLAQGGNWPQFRGHRALGITEGKATPVAWDVAKGTNVLWRVPVKGLSHSSPVVWGDKVFVTTVHRKSGEEKLSSLFGSPGYGRGESEKNDSAQLYRAVCLDRKTGRVVWERTLHEGVPKTKRHPKSSHGNPTPACDAKRLVVSFGSEGLYCLDHAGKVLWKRDLGFLNSGAPGHPDRTGYQWGFASSPVLHGERVFVQCDHEGASFVAALDLASGEDVWRKERAEDSTWCTPTVHETSAGEGGQLILNGYKHIGGYALDTGEVIWTMKGGGDVPVPTPVVAHDLVYLTSAHGRDRPLRAVRVDAKGAVNGYPGTEDEQVAWHIPRRGIYMQTPLVYRGLLYACSDGGTISCYDARSGELRYRERIGAGKTGFSGSAVACEGRIYFSGESGAVFVVAAGPEFELLGEMDMGEECMATPAISDGVIFFRTRRHVVAVGGE